MTITMIKVRIQEQAILYLLSTPYGCYRLAKWMVGPVLPGWESNYIPNIYDKHDFSDAD